MLSEVVDEYLEAGESDPDGRRLYLFLHPDSAAFVVAGPTPELLGHEHPRLAATFYHVFTGTLNRWIRTYDHRDAEDRVQMLREWAEGEEGETIKALIAGALELERASALVRRPEFTDDLREQPMDAHSPLPAALVVFAENDAIEAHFEDESQSWGEASSEPNLILPLSAFDPQSIQLAFHTLAVVCRTVLGGQSKMRKKPPEMRNSLPPISSSQLPRTAIFWASFNLFCVLCNAASVARRSVTSCLMAIKLTMVP
jgi:hypothetical protein